MADSWQADFLRVLRDDVLTEANTDELIGHLIDAIKKTLPFWVPIFMVQRVLDSLLPETLLKAIERLVLKGQ